MSDDQKTAADAITAEQLESKNFHLNVHAWLELTQTSHGVRHEDYKQYHGYCTRRLSRLKHADTQVKRLLLHSSKYQGKDSAKDASKSTKKSQNQSSQHAHCPINSMHKEQLAQQPLQTEEPLWVLLVQSERAWAQACELQPTQNAKQRAHVIRRLNKAQSYAQQLHDLADSHQNVDDTTLLELQAYKSWMKGTWALEKFDYSIACTEFANAMALCYQLADDQSGDGSDNNQQQPQEWLERKDLFITRAETVLRPLFRYCQYELKESGADADIPQEPTGGTTVAADLASPDDSIEFRGQELVIDHKELRVILLKLSSLDQTSSSTSNNEANDKQETKFLSKLSTLDDAFTLAQAQLQAFNNSTSPAAVGAATMAKKKQWELWKSYFSYQKVRAISQHTTALLHDTIARTAHAERAHVYQSLLQHAQSLLNLDGREHDDDDDEFALQAMANSLRLRAFKTYHMGMYYYEQRQQNAQAMALLQHCQELADQASEEIAACDEDMENAQTYLEDLKRLLEVDLVGAMVAVEAAIALDKLASGGGSSSTANSNRCLLQRLDDFDAGPVLADVPPVVLPIPCKGVFYDLAFDHAVHHSAEALDAIQDYVDAHLAPVTKGDSSSGSGFFGWLSN